MRSHFRTFKQICCYEKKIKEKLKFYYLTDKTFYDKWRGLIVFLSAKEFIEINIGFFWKK